MESQEMLPQTFKEFLKKVTSGYRKEKINRFYGNYVGFHMLDAFNNIKRNYDLFFQRLEDKRLAYHQQLQ